MTSTPRQRTDLRRWKAVLAASLLCAGTVTLAFGRADAAAPPVPLRTAGSFAILAGTGVSNTGPTTVTGDVGTHPTPAVTGDDQMTIDGAFHRADEVAQVAKDDLIAAYDTAAGALPPIATDAELGGELLVPGVYQADPSFQITGALTLDAEGDPDAIFIFQAAETLTTAADSSVVLLNGAQACNVFWQIGSSATLGTDSMFRGTLMALTSITLTTRATVEGRLLARNGAVVLDTNTITRPACESGSPDDDADEDSDVTDADSDGSDADGTDSDSDGSDVDGADSDSGGTDADAGEADSDADSGSPVVDVDSDGFGTDAGADMRDLPDTGGSSALLIALGVAMLVAGIAIVGRHALPRGRTRRHARPD